VTAAAGQGGRAGAQAKGQGVGASILRVEDRRLLDGRGAYLADLDIPGTQEIAFLRSPVAHARILSVHVPERYRGQVFTAEDIAFAKPIVAASAAPGFHSSEYPAFARGKVRFVGEIIAACIAPTRAEAEDIAQACEVEFDEYPAVWDMDIATAPDAARIHEGWPGNVYFEAAIPAGDIEEVRARAAVTVHRSLRMGRHVGVLFEGRGVLATQDLRTGELLVYSSTQFPHLIRTCLSRALSVPESALRVVAPDVGGGFGLKNNFHPEEIAVAALAIRTGRPLRWVEDRREHLVASPHAREHRYEMTAHADQRGRILGVEAEIRVDAGAYSVWPWTASMEAGMSLGIMTGPYDIPVYHGRAVTICTNKSPLGPYRGVGRTGACFALETLVESVARAVGRDPAEVRIENMVRPEQMPYRAATGKLYDSGDYPRVARMAAEAVGLDAIRTRQAASAAEGAADGRLIGFGMASYTEQWCSATNPRWPGSPPTASS